MRFYYNRLHEYTNTQIQTDGQGTETENQNVGQKKTQINQLLRKT